MQPVTSNEYCVVLVTTNYHPQLCGNEGFEWNSFEEAQESANHLKSLFSYGVYSVMSREDYQKHIPGCKDCATLARLTAQYEEQLKRHEARLLGGNHEE